MKKSMCFLLLMVFMLLLSSCGGGLPRHFWKPGGATFITEEHEANNVSNAKKIQIKSCDMSILYLFRWGSGDTELPYHQDALFHKLLSENDADALTDVEVRTSVLPLLVYNRACILVSGKPVKLKGVQQ